MKAFTARFPGHCAICGHKFPVGTLITWNRLAKRQYAHASCAQEKPFPSTPNEQPTGNAPDSNGATSSGSASPASSGQASPDSLQSNPNPAPTGPAIQPMRSSQLIEELNRQYANKLKEMAEKAMPAEPKPSETDKAMRAAVSSQSEFEAEPVAKSVSLPADITDKIKTTGKHFQTELIKKFLRLRKNVFLFGGPGAGKTHLAQSLAEDMGIAFAAVSCSPDMFKSELTGSRSPLNGEYYESAFRSILANGGLILWDEVGLAPGSFLNIMNAVLAQKQMLFPDGKTIKMHPDCFIMFADNSALFGDDPLFPERQDAGTAFRDRLTAIRFEYDEKLELAILTSLFSGDKTRASKWHMAVKAMRRAVEKLNLPVFVSPRFAYNGATDFMAGIDFDTVIDCELTKGIAKDIETTVKRAIEQYRSNY